MCGIFGVYRYGAEPLLSEEGLRRCTRIMSHRGPDDEGYYVDGDVALGHRRLSIIDLAGGRQPVRNEDGTLCVVFNGEIYNYRSLRHDLLRKGHVFKTLSDTEVIVHAYEEYGAACLDKFRGIFSIAIHNGLTGELFLARDHMGVKPLYYAESERGMIFASEIKPILAALDEPPGYDPAMIDFFLSLGYVPHPYTLFRGIRKVSPGTYVIVRRGHASFHSYWSPPNGIRAPADAFPSCVETLRFLLQEAVEAQLVSDVPVGVFLSGGVDSSTVVAMMRNVRDGEIKTFSVGYKEFGDVSELRYAKTVARYFGTKHFELDLDLREFFQSIEMMLEFSEEPIVESAAIALYHLARFARPEAVVLLSGEGADELFAGYPIYRRMRVIENLSRIAALLPRSAVRGLCERLPMTEKQLKYIEWILAPMKSRYKTVPSDVTPVIRDRMYTPEFRSFAGRRVEEFFEREMDTGEPGDWLARMTRLDIRYWLNDDLLLKADKMSMAASVELRVPFLDPKVVAFAFSLPDNYKLRGKHGKYILKKAMDGTLPAEIVYRPKMGFPVPIKQWFREGLHDHVSDILLSDGFLSRGIVRRDYVNGLLDSHKRGRGDHSRRIFSLVVLEMWMRRFVDEQHRGRAQKIQGLQGRCI